jgi:hypothetical protein
MRARVVGLAAFIGSACSGPAAPTPEERAETSSAEAAATPHGQVAGQFARLLVAGDFDQAASMLTPPLRAQTPPSSLAAAYAQMIAYGGAPADRVQEVTKLETWPGKQRGDRGWAHVAISGPGFSEAVAVVVTQDGLIRQVEWGRP